MLAEAKRVCDTLVRPFLLFSMTPSQDFRQLANPSQLVTNPPPPIYPVLSTMSMYQPSVASPSTSTLASSSSTAPHTTLHSPVSATTQPGIISTSPTFVVPLQQPPVYPQYTVYGSAPHTQYPTTSYYHQYATYPSPYYPHAHTQPPQPSSISVAGGTTTANTSATSTGGTTLPATAATITTTPATGGTMIGNSGPWSEEESENLKKLAENSKSRAGNAGDIDWDWVVSEWGPTRSRSVL